jgi:membrane-associated phospholipid phosphatase
VSQPWLLLGALLSPTLLCAQLAPADQPPTAVTDSVSVPARPRWYRGALVRGSLVPAALIAYGASTLTSHGLYSSYQAKQAVRRTFGPYRTRLDDYLQFAPFVEIGAALVSGVEARDQRLDLALLVVKSEALMLSSVYLTKALTQVQRPDSSTHRSFPSGHTAQAFLAASIVHTEFRDRSPWYGVGAYALATSVAALRMINNKHWQADVVAGAGFGIWSAHLAYLSQPGRGGRSRRRPERGGRHPQGQLRLAPEWYPGGAAGLRMCWRLP